MNKNLNKLYDLYINSEKGLISKPKSAAVNSVIIFPNYYNVAMSNLGFLRVYELINNSGFISCDRAFLQDDLSKGVISLEKRKRLLSYDIIFFSLSYENDFINILKILTAEKIPFLAKDRDKAFPLILAGGVIAFLNPEPISRLFDMLFVGEAEAIFPDFFHYIKNYTNLKNSKFEIIEGVGKIPGIYVPSAYDFIFDKKIGGNGFTVKDITVKPGYPEKIKRRWAANNFTFSLNTITTEYSELKSINMIEIARGCKRGCRFCSAGYIYLPSRQSSMERVLQSISATKEGDKVGFVGLATLDNQNIKNYMNHSLKEERIFSLSSIRFDCLDEETLELMKGTGLKTVTLGIETGSERIKKIINKDIKNEEVISVVRKIIEGGIINIKAYFMVGLPYEEMKDVFDTINLIKMIRREFIDSSKKQGRIGNLTIGLSPFVPKAWTPLQWENFEDVKILKKKMDFIAKEVNLPNLNLNINPVKSAFIEAFFARGSRMHLDILINSFKNGLNIKKAIAFMGFKEEDFMRKFKVDEILPWDIIDQGVTKKYLIEEYKKVLEYKLTPACFDGCKRCGIC
jgi:radical SAM superfamily enzyme YgiQ (UPF0313 family)